MLDVIIPFLAVLGPLVFVHELGHFIVAKLGGIRIEEFGLGYPPRLLRLAKIGTTEYTLNLLPLGGFVRMVGEEDPSAPGSFASKSKKVRAATLIAGPAMNIILAGFLFAITLMAGAPTPVEGPGAGIYGVMPGSPAAEAGLQVGDTIIKVNDHVVAGPEDLKAYTSAHVGERVALTIRRNGEILPEPIYLTPRASPPPGEGPMGIMINYPLKIVSYPWYQALPMGFVQAFRLMGFMLGGLVDIVRGALAPEVAGPLGIAQLTAEVAQTGVIRLVELAAFLSVNLALINLLPFPALDGGRLLFVAIEAVRRRRVDPAKEHLVHLIGLVVLISLIIVISYFDLVRWISGNSLVP